MHGKAWRKSTYSGTNTQCVEVADGGLTVLVRDTTNRGGFTMEVSALAWAKFTAGIKAA
jgi:hypothetical protein